MYLSSGLFYTEHFPIILNAVKNPAWMLRFAQHDKKGNMLSSARQKGECAFLSMTKPTVSFRASLLCHSEHPFCVIPSGSEESSEWMLHFA